MSRRARAQSGLAVLLTGAACLIGTAAPVSDVRAASYDVDEWCAYAKALVDLGALDRAQVAYRKVRKAADTCEAAKQLRAIERAQDRREELLERARSHRRAAELGGRKGQEAERQEALRIAYRDYVEALGIDPFAVGGRRGFRRLVGLNLLAPPLADCRRAAELAKAGLLPEARIIVSRALRQGQRVACASALDTLRHQRVLAYRMLRRAQASLATGDREAARREFLAALRADSSEPLALAGLDAAQPKPLVKRRNDVEEAWHFIWTQVTSPLGIVILVVGVLLLLIRVLSTVIHAHASSPTTRAIAGRLPFLKDALTTNIPYEAPPDLPAPERAMLEDTLAGVELPAVAGAQDSAACIRFSPQPVAVAPVAPPSGTVAALIDMIPVAAGARQAVMQEVTRVRTNSKVAVQALRLNSEVGSLFQELRIFDVADRRTLATIHVREDELPDFIPEEELMQAFTDLAAEKLHEALVATGAGT